VGTRCQFTETGLYDLSPVAGPFDSADTASREALATESRATTQYVGGQPGQSSRGPRSTATRNLSFSVLLGGHFLTPVARRLFGDAQLAMGAVTPAPQFAVYGYRTRNVPASKHRGVLALRGAQLTKPIFADAIDFPGLM
jgi:hypothetical protein